MADSLVILIPTHGRADLLQRTLESLRAAVAPGEVDRVLLIENGEACGVEQLAKGAELPVPVEYMFCPTRGMSAAANWGLDSLDATWIWFLNDDVRVARQAPGAYARAIRSVDDRRRFFGGPMEVDYQSPPPDWLLPHLPRSARGWHWDPQAARNTPECYQPSPDAAPQPLFLGANWVAHSEQLKAAGGFDCRLGPGQGSLACGMETGMQLALYRRGLTPHYVPEAVVYHWVPRNRCTPRWAIRRAYRMGVGAALSQPDPAPAVFGYPRWMLPVLARRFASWLATRLSRSPERRFCAGYQLALFLGQLAGKRRARLAFRQGNDLQADSENEQKGKAAISN